MLFTYDKITRVLLCGLPSLVLAEVVGILGLANCTLAFLFLWLLSSAIYLASTTIKVDVAGKAVFVTGCDTGFGHALALHLHKLGFRVFAGCLLAEKEGEGAAYLREVKSERLHVLQLDITNDEQIKQALEDVKKLLPANEVLWGFVNNAAITTCGAIEWVPLQTVRRVAAVNIFGTINVTRTFLPLLRKAKGRVVNVVSVRGRMISPQGSTYDLTKYALEGFSDGLRNEMRMFGVTVAIIEPGNFTLGTRIFSEELVQREKDLMWKQMSDEVKSAYGEEFFESNFKNHLATTKSGERDVTEVMEAMTDALMQRWPQGRYQPMDILCYVMVWTAQHCPEWVYDYLFIEYLLKKGW